MTSLMIDANPPPPGSSDPPSDLPTPKRPPGFLSAERQFLENN